MYIDRVRHVESFFSLTPTEQVTELCQFQYPRWRENSHPTKYACFAGYRKCIK